MGNAPSFLKFKEGSFLIKPLFHWLPCETLLQGHCLSDWTGKVEEEFFAKT